MNDETLFQSALERPAGQRAEFLRQACGGDHDLLRRVTAVLAAHENPGGFLEIPCLTPPTLPTDGARPPGDLDLGFLSPPSHPNSLGRLDHYEILEVVGTGGFGVVLKARDTSLERIVAIKVLAESLAGSATARKRFVREAKAAAAVRHDNVVSIHSVADCGRVPYLVMEFVAGQSLDERLKSEGPLEVAEILRIGVQTAEGLAAAHQHGLVHRDVKPGNILLENGVQRVKITDFGLARAADDASLTQAGQIAGTPEFMSPEQARGTAIDHRSDLFALGSVLYAMCTGHAPFRASTTLGVLRKVCDEQPLPMSELNPGIPEWLTEIVVKLHAKEPAERFASAAEVAEVLRSALASLQQPTSALRTPMKPPVVRRRPQTGAHWLTAAAALALVAITIGLAESQGVTQIAATFVRVFTPDGTLLVEANDPGVKVTIEGDGGLTITGAGLEEIRLRPGNYKVHADKDGQPLPLEKELVSISKGGREVVKVKLERPQRTVAATADRGAFVVLGAGKERKFDTLAEAVRGASDGDTIEIRGNGPFDTPPITMKRALVIQAGRGQRPVIRLPSSTQAGEVALFATEASLTLEGLDLQIGRRDGQESPPTGAFAVISEAASLRLANCTLLNKQGRLSGILNVRRSPRCELRNCLILADTGGRVLDWTFSKDKGDLVMDNCLQAGGGPIYFSNFAHDPRDVSVVVTRSTRIAGGLFGLCLNRPLDLPAGAPPAAFIRLEASGNVSEGWWIVFQLDQITKQSSPPQPALPTAELQALLPRMLAWQGKQNVYSVGNGGYLALTLDYKVLSPSAPIAMLKDWTRFLNAQEDDSLEGFVRLQGGDLVERAKTAAETITPEDFRLRPDSAGYRAGPDGKDLGADVDLVGPGPAYERWKKTPAYQQWLKEAGQTK